MTGRRQSPVCLRTNSDFLRGCECQCVIGRVLGSFGDALTLKGILFSWDSCFVCIMIRGATRRLSLVRKQTHYFISGSETHTVHIDFPQSARLKASPSSLVYMSQGVEMTTEMFGGLAEGFGRLLSGASLMLVQFAYAGEGMGHVVLGPNFYSKLLPLDLKAFGGTVVCRKDSFVVGPEDTKVDVHVIRSFLSLIGGEGMLLQRISGSGTVLIKASGAIHTMNLAAGESLYLHPGALVAYEDTTVSYDVQPVPGAKNIFFGQGLFLVKVTGPGKVIIQSMSETKFAQSLHIAGGSTLVDSLILADIALGHPSAPVEGAAEPDAQDSQVSQDSQDSQVSQDSQDSQVSQDSQEAQDSGTAEEASDNAKWGFDETASEATEEIPTPDAEESSGLLSDVIGWIKDFFTD